MKLFSSLFLTVIESGGDYCAVEEALNNMENVNYKNSFGDTALIIGKFAYKNKPLDIREFIF